ncbi:hypothetical protein P691DRAFT_710960 [Macrolepiota fuliginosa MF-IS2]|uniref:BTB domain-containing protein n=1 Tax=Macrolepiota fuliginosa MF-IS2 TaxID=1400762 RepID=A0A9P6BYE6_9AGAR|nr:hypothetical protein P691DRAFT_710960 [Macrolepiota fuliginosa MF-IS2]
MMPPKPSIIHNPLKGLSYDSRYNLPNGDLYFRVEQTIFCVHSYFFTRESPYYRERMAGGDCARVHDGRSNVTAIPVHDTSVEDFHHFLWVFYNPEFAYSAPASVWQTILTLSSQSHWDFPKVHALALSHLENINLPLVDRITLYRDCSVSIEHLIPLYTELCLREEPIVLEEAVRLGWELSNLVYRVRERLLRGGGMGGAILDLSSAVEGVAQDQVQDLVKSMLDATQEQSSIMGLREPKSLARQDHTYDQVRSIFDPSPQPKSTIRTRQQQRQRHSKPTQVTIADLITKPGESSKSTTQAFNQAQKLVQTAIGSIKKKGKSVVNA